MSYEMNGSNQHLTASNPVDAVPLTLACWFRSDVTAVKNLLYVSDSALTRTFGMYLGATGNLRGYVRGASVADFPAAANYSTATWHHACLTCSSNTSRSVYLDGGNAATNSTSVTPDAGVITTTFMGYTVGTLDGRIAEVGIWNAALTADEVLALGKGAAPCLVRPQSLVFYAPLIRELIDVRGGRVITNNNSATVAEHPRVYR